MLLHKQSYFRIEKPNFVYNVVLLKGMLGGREKKYKEDFNF